MTTQAQTDAVARLAGSHWNAGIQTDANPGGLDGDGHYLNFPAALTDTGLAAQYVGEQVTLAAAWVVTAHGVAVPGAPAGSYSAVHYVAEAMEAAALAQAWASAGAGVEVAPGLYSASAYATLSAAAATAAAGSAGGASGSATLSAAWAETAEDVDVPGAAPGSRSALHYAAQSAGSAAAAAFSASAAQGLRTATVSGTADAIILTCTPPVTVMTRPVAVEFIAIATSTGAVTIAPDGLGAVALLGPDGAALGAGAIVAGSQYLIASDGAAFRLTAAPPATDIGLLIALS